MQSLRVMDPIRGRHVIRDKELRDEFSEIAFELAMVRWPAADRS